MCRNNLLVLEILFQRDAVTEPCASCALGIVQDVAAGVSGEVLFNHLFPCNPVNAIGQAGQSGGIYDCFHELFLSHDYVSCTFFESNKLVSIPTVSTGTFF